jgi:hypothetical protein
MHAPVATHRVPNRRPGFERARAPAASGAAPRHRCASSDATATGSTSCSYRATGSILTT